MPGRGAPAELALVRRGGFDESRHLGDVVVLGRDGGVLLELGDPAAAMLPRSTLKPIQAEASIDAGAALEGAEVALAAASHAGQDFHLDAVRRVLGRVGLEPGDLQCPPDREPPEPIRMECSGKHAAMLSACVHNGWVTDTYLDADHPLQQRIRQAVAYASGESLTHATTDGCGAPVYAISLRGLARAYRRLVTAEVGSTPYRIGQAMTQHPAYVAGDGKSDTLAMQALPGLIAKTGAEGVLAMAMPTGESVAVKILDGNPRAATMVALAALSKAGVDVTAADELRDLPVLGGGRRVGEIAPGADLR